MHMSNPHRKARQYVSVTRRGVAFDGAILRRLRTQDVPDQPGPWTQIQLAAAVGVAPQQISLWERGHSAPSLASLRSLADVLAVAPRDLMPEHLRYANLSALRYGAAITARTAAEALGLNRATYSIIESGSVIGRERGLTQTEAEILEALYNVTLDDIARHVPIYPDSVHDLRRARLSLLAARERSADR